MDSSRRTAAGTCLEVDPARGCVIDLKIRFFARAGRVLDIADKGTTGLCPSKGGDVSDTAWYDDERNGGRRSEQPPSREALRLTFRFDGDQVELTGVQAIRKLIPPRVGSEPEEGKHAGEWLQLRDREDRVLYTRVLNDPLRTRVDVHDAEKGPSIVVGPPTNGTFDVLMPDLPDAVVAVLYASPPVEGAELRPAVVVGRYELPPSGRAGAS